jgi:hypothetical protein
MNTVIPTTPDGQPTRTRAELAPPPRVLICVGNASIRELISLLLAHVGCAVAGMEVMDWLMGRHIPGPRPAVLLLDARPLRQIHAVEQARARLAAEPTTLVLLSDIPLSSQLIDELGAVATLPLRFTLHALITAVQPSHRAGTRTWERDT